MSLKIDLNSKPASRPKPQIFSRFKKNPKPPKPDLPMGEKEKRKKKIKKISLIVLGALVIFGGYYAFKAFQFADTIGLRINPQDILNINKDPELKRDSSGTYTAGMIVGIDTRNANSGLKNTDTIMVVNYNHKTKDTVMVSIPRDFFVEVPNEGWYTKINSVYWRGEAIEEGSGLEYLKGVVEEVMGMEIQYYGMIDLQGFRQVIDAVGGVVVNVENSFTDYQYPTETPGVGPYEVVSFQKGPQLMDGATALKYARSRHSPDNNEGSDFARARRQQRLIVAMKDKLLTSETYFNPQKVLEVLSAVQDNVRVSDFTARDIQAAINVGSGQQENGGGIFSFVLDPAIGNFTVVTDQLDAGNAYAIGPKLGLGNYDDVHTLISTILKYPGVYSEDPVIRVYDTGLGYQASYQKTLELLEKAPYLDIRFMGTLFADKTGSVVYDHTENLNGKSTARFADILKTDMTTQPDYITTNLNGEEITILLGAPETAQLDEGTQE